MFIDHEIRLDYSDVLIVPRESTMTSRAHVELLVDHFDTPVTPFIAANMDGVGTFQMCRALATSCNAMTALIKHYPIDELVEFYSNEVYGKFAIYSMGANEQDLDKFDTFKKLLEETGADEYITPTVCIDVANGYTKSVLDFINQFAVKYPEHPLMVGNVCTPERTEDLIGAGADIVKVGLGSGSVCTTRKMTGIGYPQFSAVLECAAAADAAGGNIVADGGITCPGDAVKAFAAGAKYVMLGGYLAGHIEGGVAMNKHKVAPFYGMASATAQAKYNGGVSDYRASEGKQVLVPVRGYVDETIKTFTGGIRSACTYVGAESVSDLHKRSRFIRVNNQLNKVFD